MTERKPSEGAIRAATFVDHPTYRGDHTLAAETIDREAVAPAVRDIWGKMEELEIVLDRQINAENYTVKKALQDFLFARSTYYRIKAIYRHLLDEPTTYGPTRSHDGDLVE